MEFFLVVSGEGIDCVETEFFKSHNSALAFFNEIESDCWRVCLRFDSAGVQIISANNV